MKTVLFDSDVIIELLRGNNNVRRAIRELIESKVQLAYTVVTEAEVYHGLRKDEEERVGLTLSILDCVEINREMGRQAGIYLRRYAKSHGMDVADALIAAAASETGYSLCTFNWKHYPMTDIEKHHLLKP